MNQKQKPDKRDWHCLWAMMVSSYLKKIFDFYSLEGIDMAYTQEMWVRDYDPDNYNQLLSVKEGILNKGKKEGMLAEAKEMVLEALDINFTNVPEEIHKKIIDLNNRALLRKLLRSAILSKNINVFEQSIQEIIPG